jgi:hypothetical protein
MLRTMMEAAKDKPRRLLGSIAFVHVNPSPLNHSRRASSPF